MTQHDRGRTVGAMKTAISIPDALLEAADALAARLGVSRSVLFQQAVEAGAHRTTEGVAVSGPRRRRARSPMKAIRISATVGRDRTLVLQLPTETPEGMAEVIVLVPESRPESTDLDRLLRSADEWRSRHPERGTKESIDRELAEERAAWGDR